MAKGGVQLIAEIYALPKAFPAGNYLNLKLDFHTAKHVAALFYDMKLVPGLPANLKQWRIRKIGSGGILGLFLFL